MDWEKGVGNSREKIERIRMTISGEKEGLRKRVHNWLSEQNITHSRKHEAHDINRFWAQIQVEPISHTLGAHNYILVAVNLIQIIFNLQSI